jgi:hypothetical protein
VVGRAGIEAARGWALSIFDLSPEQLIAHRRLQARPLRAPIRGRQVIFLQSRSPVELAPVSPRSRLALATSPFQRMADALAAEPARVWALHDLYELGECSWEDAKLCFERLVREGLLECHRESLWRAGDLPAGLGVWGCS